MKTATWAWIVIIILIIIAGGWYWWSMQMPASNNAAPMIPATSPTTSPSGAAGTNDSVNQGNLGQPDNGQVQQPGQTSQGDGTSVSENLALGLDSNATLGKYLIAYNGMTLYTYKPDGTGASTCYGSCAQAWPPYTVPAGSTLNLEAGVTGTISTITRTDGTQQVTYNGMPLYFYAGDTASGQTNGQGLSNVWYVVKP